MKLNERAKILGLRRFLGNGVPTMALLVCINDTDAILHNVFKDKKGSYIKIKDYYLEGFEDLGKVKKYYLKDDLWWAVNRFEKYLEKENGCAATQPK